jgi:hypothetical protein
MAEAVAEITETSTSEDIQSFVETIAAERAGDQADASKPEPKGDAAIVNSVAAIETPKAPVASKGDETTAEAPAGKGEKTPDRSWLDDDLKAEVSAFGISEDELADFSSREEVERAMRLFDKSALEAGRKAMAEGKADGGEAKGARDDKGRFTKTETPNSPETPDSSKAPANRGGYEVQLDKSIYDDGIVDEFTRLRDHYEDRLAVLESRFLAADQQAEQKQFDSLVDSLGHTDLFGKADKEDAKQRQRREDLYVAAKAHIVGLQAFGRTAEMSESLINRVARMVFADELGKKDLKSRTSRISRQSNGRMGGSATRPDQPRESAREEAERLYKELVGS